MGPFLCIDFSPIPSYKLKMQEVDEYRDTETLCRYFEQPLDLDPEHGTQANRPITSGGDSPHVAA